MTELMDPLQESDSNSKNRKPSHYEKGRGKFLEKHKASEEKLAEVQEKRFEKDLVKNELQVTEEDIDQEINSN